MTIDPTLSRLNSYTPQEAEWKHAICQAFGTAALMGLFILIGHLADHIAPPIVGAFVFGLPGAYMTLSAVKNSLKYRTLRREAIEHLRENPTSLKTLKRSLIRWDEKDIRELAQVARIEIDALEGVSTEMRMLHLIALLRSDRPQFLGNSVYLRWSNQINRAGLAKELADILGESEAYEQISMNPNLEPALVEVIYKLLGEDRESRVDRLSAQFGLALRGAFSMHRLRLEIQSTSEQTHNQWLVA